MKCFCPHCKGEFDLQPVRMLTPEEIISRTIKHFGITKSQMTNCTRKADVVAARHTAMYLISKRSSLSDRLIGDYFNRDRTSVIHAVKRCEDSFDTRADLYKHIISIENELN